MKKYIIIPGSNRSGSTSLYYYLKENGLNVSNEKQIDYLSKDFSSINIIKYDEFFQNLNSDILKVDVSPDYIYSDNFLDNVKKIFNKSELLIILLLRNPFDRVVSWHKYGKQLGEVEISESLETFISKNSSNSEKESYRSVDRSDYYKWLNPIINYFGKDDILFLSTNKLNSKESINQLQKFIRKPLFSNPKFLNQSGIINNGPLWFTYRKIRSLALSILKFFKLTKHTKTIRFYIGSLLRYSFINKTKIEGDSNKKLRDSFMKDWRKRNEELCKYLDENDFPWIK